MPIKLKKQYEFLNTALTISERVNDLVKRLTTEEKLRMLSTSQGAVPRLGVQEWHIGLEVARGYVGREDNEISTVFPQPIGLASTFDSELMGLLGEIAGNECRIYNKKELFSKLMVWGPTVDLCRHPLWGRNEEGYGEDPCLTGEMTTAYTKGMRGNDRRYLKTVPTLKHFCANNHEEDRGTDNAELDLRLKYEYYYTAFEASIKSGNAFSLMTAYNEINGVPGMQDPDLQKVCKDKWGLGFVVTDGGDFGQNVNMHKYSFSHATTLAETLKAGGDIMTDSSEAVFEAGKLAYNEGLLTDEVLDRTVANVLTYRFRLGEFDDKSLNPYGDIDETLLNCDKYKKINHRAAKECITLLKNEKLLPLSKNKINKLAVIGPLADGLFRDWYTGNSDYNISVLDGFCAYIGEQNVFHDDGYHHIAIKSEKTGKYLTLGEDDIIVASGEKKNKSSQFKKIDWDDEINLRNLKNNLLITEAPVFKASRENNYSWFVRETFRPCEYLGKTLYKTWDKKDAVIDDNGCLTAESRSPVKQGSLFSEEVVSNGFDRACELAAKSDAVVICVGNDPMMGARECFDRKSLALPLHQKKLIEAVSEINKNVILLVISSYPYTLNEEQNNKNIKSIIYTAHGGPEMGSAVAKTIFGEYNPAGRTCQTWYKSELDLPSLKNYDIINEKLTYLYFDGEPLYPFGYGKSYSDFEYSDLKIEDNNKHINVNICVRNISKLDGEEVVQVYYTPKNPSVKRANKALCAFKRILITAGESERISLKIDKEKLRFYDVSRGKFVVPDDDYLFSVGASSEDIRLTEEVHVNGETVPPRKMNKAISALSYDEKSGVALCWSRIEKAHYVNASGWDSKLIFNNVELIDAGIIQLKASTQIGSGKVEVFIDEILASIVEIPASSVPEKFTGIKCSFTEKYSGIHKVILKPSGGVNIMDIRIY